MGSLIVYLMSDVVQCLIHFEVPLMSLVMVFLMKVFVLGISFDLGR